MQGKNGKTVSERQQAYKNTGTGVDKLAHEKMMDSQGRKVVKERKNGNVEQYDHYYNLNEENRDEFDRQWQQNAKQIKMELP